MKVIMYRSRMTVVKACQRLLSQEPPSSLYYWSGSQSSTDSSFWVYIELLKDISNILILKEIK